MSNQRSAISSQQFVFRHSPLVILILLALYPLLTSNYPTIGDGLNHFYRLAELERHITQGDLYPRWLANLHYGYGSPLFNFYSPLSYYVALIFRVIFPLATSLQAGYILALIVAIIGVYLWARDEFDSDLAALASAAAYGLAPYLYFNIFHRGAYPETWGLALAPWVIRSALRLTRHPSRIDLLAFPLLYAALILTHTITAFIFTPILLLLVISNWGIAFSPQPSALKQRISSLFTFHFLLFILGIGLAASFILPIIFESQYVQLNRTVNLVDLDYRNNFITFSTLFSFPPNFDPNLVANFMPASLSLGTVGLVIGCWLLVAGYWLKNRTTLVIDNLPFVIRHLSFVIIIGFFTLPISQPLWSAIPFVQYIQFPWRLVGVASLFLAMLVGASVNQLYKLDKRLGLVVLGFGILVIFISSLSWTYHTKYPTQPATVSPTDTLNYEISNEQLGTTSNGEYLPKWVSEVPKEKFALDAKCLITNIKLDEDEIRCNADKDFVLTLNRFYFPGWSATLDSKAIEITPSAPNGLITLQIPTGQHTIKVFLQPTAPQIIGLVISLVASCWLLVASRQPSAISQLLTSNLHLSFDIRHSTFFSVFILSLFIVHLFAPFRSSPPIGNNVSVAFDNQLELIGFEYPAALISGDSLDLNLYWRAIVPLNKNYSTTIQLADKFGNRYGGSDSQHPNQTPTSRWSPDQYARDSHHLVSLSGTPPGEYRLLVGVHEHGKPLSIIQDEAPIGIEYEIGKVTVTSAKPQPGGALRIIEAKLANDKIESGDRLAFTALINSGDAPAQGVTASLFLVDTQNRPSLNQPLAFIYPPQQWSRNELIRQPFDVDLPPDLNSGTYRVGLIMRDANQTIIHEYAVGLITITAPQRTFDIPKIDQIINHDFKESVRLLGYNIKSDSITLYWQSLKPVTKRLTIFVHRLNPDGTFAAGADLAPARATTSWIKGEVITTVHPISVGNTFEIGLYDPVSGDRFDLPFIINH